MSKERYAGMWLELSGRIAEVWGEWFGDPDMADTARRDQAVGRVQQDSAREREQAARQLKDFRHNHRNWLF